MQFVYFTNLYEKQKKLFIQYISLQVLKHSTGDMISLSQARMKLLNSSINTDGKRPSILVNNAIVNNFTSHHYTWRTVRLPDNNNCHCNLLGFFITYIFYHMPIVLNHRFFQPYIIYNNTQHVKFYHSILKIISRYRNVVQQIQC